jgi:hypothetical protein
MRIFIRPRIINLILSLLSLTAIFIGVTFLILLSSIFLIIALNPISSGSQTYTVPFSPTFLAKGIVYKPECPPISRITSFSNTYLFEQKLQQIYPHFGFHFSYANNF